MTPNQTRTRTSPTLTNIGMIPSSCTGCFVAVCNLGELPSQYDRAFIEALIIIWSILGPLPCPESAPLSEANFPRCLRRSEHSMLVDGWREPFREAPHHTQCIQHIESLTVYLDVSGRSFPECPVDTLFGERGGGSEISDTCDDRICLDEPWLPFMLDLIRMEGLSFGKAFPVCPPQLVFWLGLAGILRRRIWEQWSSICCNRQLFRK